MLPTSITSKKIRREIINSKENLEYYEESFVSLFLSSILIIKYSCTVQLEQDYFKEITFTPLKPTSSTSVNKVCNSEKKLSYNSGALPKAPVHFSSKFHGERAKLYNYKFDG